MTMSFGKHKIIPSGSFMRCLRCPWLDALKTKLCKVQVKVSQDDI